MSLYPPGNQRGFPVQVVNFKKWPVGRMNHTAVVKGDKMWVFGGIAADKIYGDVFSVNLQNWVATDHDTGTLSTLES